MNKQHVRQVSLKIQKLAIHINVYLTELKTAVTQILLIRSAQKFAQATVAYIAGLMQRGHDSIAYGSGHGGAAVLLPDFAISW